MVFMALPKHDYDGDGFYDEILTLSMQGLTNAEIADSLSLDPETFSTMKNGKYIGWNEEENARRSARILNVLARGRRKVIAAIRGRYLKAALGGIKTKNVQKLMKPVLDENGNNTGENIVIQISETEFESSPNIQALTTLLYHYDPEWRRVQRGEPDPEEASATTDDGLNIEAWIAKESEMCAAAEEVINAGNDGEHNNP